MSQTFSIACRDCEVGLWIAQARYDGTERTLYSGNPDIMAALRDFLFDHRGHGLVFDENVESAIGMWREIQIDGDDDDEPLPQPVRTID